MQFFENKLVGARGISNVLAADSIFHIFYLVLFHETAALPMLFSSTMHAYFKQNQLLVLVQTKCFPVTNKF